MAEAPVPPLVLGREGDVVWLGFGVVEVVLGVLGAGDGGAGGAATATVFTTVGLDTVRTTVTVWAGAGEAGTGELVTWLGELECDVFESTVAVRALVVPGTFLR